jgi:hypothetical protein
MAKNTLPKPASGFVGFGCAFLVSAVALISFGLPQTGYGITASIAVAVVLGLITARFGEPFFERLLSLVRWL